MNSLILKSISPLRLFLWLMLGSSVITFGFACASAAPVSAPIPQYYIDPANSPHLQCPTRRFFSEAASSVTSANDAEQAARARLVKKLGSKIRVQSKRIVDVVRKNGTFSSKRELLEVSQEQATFAHAELIFRQGVPWVNGDKTYVLVCLDRNKARAALEQDLHNDLTRFMAVSEQAVQAVSTGRISAFTTPYHEAAKLAPKCLAAFAKIRAISAQPSNQEVVFTQRWTAVWNSSIRINKITQLNKTLLLMQCKNPEHKDAACPARLVNKIRSAATAAGFELLPGRTSVPVQENFEQMALQSGAVHLLHVSIQAQFMGEVEGEFFAKASASAEHIDIIAGEIKNTLQVGPLKGGEFSRQKAIDLALLKATSEIAGEIEILK